MADWKMGGVPGSPALPDVTHALVTPTGGVSGTAAAHIASKVTAAGGDASATVVLPAGASTARTMADVAADVDDYDLILFLAGVPTDAQVLARVVAARAVTFPANLTGSRGSVRVNPTAQAVITLKKNGT